MTTFLKRRSTTLRRSDSTPKEDKENRSTEDDIDTEFIWKEPDRIGVKIGKTINIGNFESDRIDLGLEKVAKRGINTEEEFDKIWRFLKKLLNKYEREKQRER